LKKLKNELEKIDGKGYKSYKSIKGSYNFNQYTLDIVYVQGDPFASPSLLKVIIDLDKYAFDKKLYLNQSRKIAFEDYVGRVFKNSTKKEVKGHRGSGKSGSISIYGNKQEILQRSSVEIKGNKLNIKFNIGLPASGRRVLAREAINMFFKEIPKIITNIEKSNINLSKLETHIKTNEKSDILRGKLSKLGLIAFVANDSILPRKSGVDDRAMSNAILFKSPKKLEIEIDLENGEKIIGMGIKKGITIITGGGFHGKSTLLTAIEKGVYNHIPGDGRELVITDYNAVKIRAEDGRGISNVNISPFINNLPFGKDTVSFSTEDASGSTSQATNIIESLEIGAEILLIDEDTSATNFMMRDIKIQNVIKKEKEPITPFIERIRGMYEEMGISTLVVVGGLGDYFDVADTVLMLDEYEVKDITKMAKEVIEKYNNENQKREYFNDKFEIKEREINSNKILKMFGSKIKTKSRDTDTLSIGKGNDVDIRYLEQMIENGQTDFIGEIIKKIATDKNDIKIIEIVNEVEKQLESKSITEFFKNESGNLAVARKYEIAATINRIRGEVLRTSN